MAIDSRIALAINPLNIGERVSQNVQNLQQIDLMNQRREQAPFKNQLMQLEAELAQAQQPANLQQAEFAASGEQQLINKQRQMQEIATSYASSLQPLVGNPQALVSELQRQKQMFSARGIDTRGIDEDIVQAQTPEGREMLAQEFMQALMPQGQQQKSVSQVEYENLLRDAQGDPSDTRTKAARIKLRLDPGATGSAAITTAQDPDLTDKVAKSQAEIEEAKKQATEKVVTTETGRRGAIAKALNFAGDTLSKLGTTKSLIDNYKSAIEQLDAGAETGIIYSMLPSFDTNNLILDNIASQAGFDLAKSGGGIITEADMEFGMRTAIPQGLNPAALKEFLTKKVAAQEKIVNHIKEVATFLGGGDKTLPDWYNLQNSKGKVTRLSDKDLIGGF